MYKSMKYTSMRVQIDLTFPLVEFSHHDIFLSPSVCLFQPLETMPLAPLARRLTSGSSTKPADSVGLRAQPWRTLYYGL